MSNDPNTAGDFEIELDVASIAEPVDFKGGWHEATVKSVRPSKSQKGNTVLNVQWSVADTDEDYAGRSVWDAIVFTDDAAWKVKQLFTAIGQSDFKGKLRANDLIGERAMLKVAMEASTGINPQTGQPWEPRPRVQRYAPLGSAGESLESLIS